jgi:hypothetical protein
MFVVFKGMRAPEIVRLRRSSPGSERSFALLALPSAQPASRNFLSRNRGIPDTHPPENLGLTLSEQYVTLPMTSQIKSTYSKSSIDCNYASSRNGGV